MASNDQNIAGGFFVDPKGLTCTVTITTKAGATPTVYTDRTLGSTHTMPKKITSGTTFIVKNEDDYTISCKIGGFETLVGGSAQTVRIDSGKILPVAPQAMATDVSKQAGAGLLLTAPNGTAYVVTVSNAGALVVTAA